MSAQAESEMSMTESESSIAGSEQSSEAWYTRYREDVAEECICWLHELGVHEKLKLLVDVTNQEVDGYRRQVGFNRGHICCGSDIVYIPR